MQDSKENFIDEELTQILLNIDALKNFYDKQAVVSGKLEKTAVGFDKDTRALQIGCSVLRNLSYEVLKATPLPYTGVRKRMFDFFNTYKLPMKTATELNALKSGLCRGTPISLEPQGVTLF